MTALSPVLQLIMGFRPLSGPDNGRNPMINTGGGSR